jgi:hypothetical protein
MHCVLCHLRVESSHCLLLYNVKVAGILMVQEEGG